MGFMDKQSRVRVYYDRRFIKSFINFDDAQRFIEEQVKRGESRGMYHLE